MNKVHLLVVVALLCCVSSTLLAEEITGVVVDKSDKGVIVKPDGSDETVEFRFRWVRREGRWTADPDTKKQASDLRKGQRVSIEFERGKKVDFIGSISRLAEPERRDKDERRTSRRSSDDKDCEGKDEKDRKDGKDEDKDEDKEDEWVFNDERFEKDFHREADDVREELAEIVGGKWMRGQSWRRTREVLNDMVDIAEKLEKGKVSSMERMKKELTRFAGSSKVRDSCKRICNGRKEAAEELHEVFKAMAENVEKYYTTQAELDRERERKERRHEGKDRDKDGKDGKDRKHDRRGRRGGGRNWW